MFFEGPPAYTARVTIPPGFLSFSIRDEYIECGWLANPQCRA